MSGFDVAFRTQSMLAPIEMEAGRRRNEGIQSIGNSAQMAAQQFSQEQARQQELQMRKAESDTKIAMWQQEQQINAYKMQNLLALDEAGMSRIQVAMAREQLASVEMANEEQRKKSQAVPPSEAARLDRARIEHGLFESDPRMYRDPSTGEWGAATPEQQREREAEIHRNKNQRSDPPLDVNRAFDPEYLASVNSQGYHPTQKPGGGWALGPATPEQVQAGRARQAQIEQEKLQELDKRISGRENELRFRALQRLYEADLTTASEKLIRMSPDNPAYKDTMAEVERARKKLAELAGEVDAAELDVGTQLDRILDMTLQMEKKSGAQGR